MRTGFSTSACAAAAAVAALRALTGGKTVANVAIDLPTRRGVAFSIVRCEWEGDGVRCGVVKDAGDDPDVTNGLEIQALVRPSETGRIEIQGGIGVGTVTLPGLSVAVGEAAINPGPRRLILHALRTETERLGLAPEIGLSVTVCVPDGERIARETMNPKLGIVGGISILGTDGLVHPYSVPAFRTSLYYELKVAKENGSRTVAFATGKRSLQYLKSVLPKSNELELINVGDEIGFPIDRALRFGFSGIYIGGMIGKLSKLAQGRFQTHVNEGEVDFDFLASVAVKAGAQPRDAETIRTCRTARQAQQLLKPFGVRLEPILTEMAAQSVWERCRGKADIGVYLFNLTGDLLASSFRPAEKEEGVA